MGRYIVLGAGTVCAVLFLIQLYRGAKYDYAVKNLDSGDFPLHNLYGVGFSWSSGRIFRLSGNLAAKMRQDASMLYPHRFAEYYANVSWAGAITLMHFALSVALLLGGLLFPMAAMIILIGVFSGIYMAANMTKNMGDRVRQRTERCELQLADVVSSLAVLLNSGMLLRDAWKLIGNKGEGELYALIRQSTENMKSGMSEREAFAEFGRLSNSADVSKFIGALMQNMEKGGSELVNYLTSQSSQMWQEKRQRMLQNGEKAATKLLVPIVLIFLGVLVIILAAAFGGTMFGSF